MGDHEAGIEARLAHQERRQAGQGGVDQQRDAALGERAVSAIASASVSAAKATGSAWKFRPR
jgi:hypothetical protein